MNIFKAVTLANRLHAGQNDKAGEPYIGHCVRVMLRVMFEAAWTDDVLVAALLHDAIEDGCATEDELEAAGVSQVSLAIIVCLTKRRGADYADYLRELRRWDAAIAIKRADIADNTDESRLALLLPETAARLREKYRHALLLLEQSASQI